MILDTCHSVHEVSYVYRHRFGSIPIDSAGERPSIVTGARLGAVVMPQRLGWSVRNRLRGRGKASVPVITHPRHRRWVFLVHRNREVVRQPTARRLAAGDVVILDPGCRVWLPMSDSRISWYWASAPEVSRVASELDAPTCSRVLTVAKALIEERARMRPHGG
ncbi:hypothetical protein ACFXNW_18355 [Nocardia sp. NPDC059180]|uniref:hypothetical protein n=1 Tax=Nocardia sp. NPDC059180 TaxID=3346761 RepID=UPI00369DF0DF